MTKVFPLIFCTFLLSCKNQFIPLPEGPYKIETQWGDLKFSEVAIGKITNDTLKLTQKYLLHCSNTDNSQSNRDSLFWVTSIPLNRDFSSLKTLREEVQVIQHVSIQNGVRTEFTDSCHIDSVYALNEFSINGQIIEFSDCFDSNSDCSTSEKAKIRLSPIEQNN